jgi:hypothetical protein
MTEVQNTAVKTSVSLEELSATLRTAGYRAAVGAQNGRPVIQSAAQGLGFVLVPGNALGTDAQRFADFSFNCLIRLESNLPPIVIERWNQSKRFGRMFRQQDVLALALDVIVAGGVTERFLLTQCELWDRLMHDFIAHLRENVPAAAAAATAARAATPAAAPPARPGASPTASQPAPAVQRAAG